MKKYFSALCFFLASCTMENSTFFNKVQNELCMDMERFQIFQTFPANYALANNCKEDDRDYCFGAVVLLTPQRNVDYYDSMFVTLPAGKCAVQDGIYRYEAKNGLKTVPRIRWGFKYAPENEEEAITRLNEYMEDRINECKSIYASDEKTNTEENMKNCDCSIKEAVKYSFQKSEEDETSSKDVVKDVIKHVKEKCGKIPDFF